MIHSMNGGVIDELIVESIVAICVLTSNFRVPNCIESFVTTLLEAFIDVEIYVLIG